MYNGFRNAMRSVVLAPAKVNLHLAVGERRDDGFHSIESVFARTDLCDELEVEIAESEVADVRVRGLAGFCEPGKDTMSKAARTWMGKSGRRMCLLIRCTKRIPSQAGLGGGSSDAASLLLLLDSLYPMERGMLQEVAAEVGSDVPFFLSRSRFAWVTGRGERVEPVEGVGPLYGALVMPSALKCSTKEAYEALDRLARPAPPAKSLVLDALRSGPANYGKVMRNDFFEVVKTSQPYGSLIRAADGLVGYGALSGSGSCWFFVSEDKTFVDRYIARLGEMDAGRFRSWFVQI